MTESIHRKVELFDTSLRDGMQQPNLDISVPNAVMLLQRMGAFGVRYAEIGFAGANQFVSDLTGALSGVDTGAMKLALFGRSRGRGTKVEEWPDVKFIIANRKRVPAAVIVVKSRLLDIAKSLETTPEENLLMVAETFIVCKTTAWKSWWILSTPWTPPAADVNTEFLVTPIPGSEARITSTRWLTSASLME